jgi:HSP20 family protein
MTTRKPSFFERLTGSIKMTDDDLDFPQTTRKNKTGFLSESFDDENDYNSPRVSSPVRTLHVDSDEVYEEDYTASVEEPVEEIAELSVDVFYDNENIYIQTMTAGVKKEDLEIVLSREEVIIRGTREQVDFAYDAHYAISELYWGNFERIISLPDEVDIERAKAHESHGLVTLTLPKFDKKRQTTLRVE